MFGMREQGELQEMQSTKCSTFLLLISKFVGQVGECQI